MGDTGFETTPFSNEETSNRRESGAKSGASGAQSAILTDADDALGRLLAVWPMLSDADRRLLAEKAESFTDR